MEDDHVVAKALKPPSAKKGGWGDPAGNPDSVAHHLVAVLLESGGMAIGLQIKAREAEA